MTAVIPFIILLKAVALSPTFLRGPKRKSVCYKLTTQAIIQEPCQLDTGPPQSILDSRPSGTGHSPPGPEACSSWAQSLEFLISRPGCQGSAVFRVILLHVVGGEPANLQREQEVVRAVSAHSPLFLNTPGRVPRTSGPLHLPRLLLQKVHPPEVHVADTPPPPSRVL